MMHGGEDRAHQRDGRYGRRPAAVIAGEGEPERQHAEKRPKP